jgi:hypothetical protein
MAAVLLESLGQPIVLSHQFILVSLPS